MDEKASKKQAQSDDMIRKQKLQIDAMATPIMSLWEGILFLPIIGVVDTHRSQVTMDGLLKEIEKKEAKVVILDILGVLSVDTAVANHLVKITKATKLMGCDCIISGMSPEVAKTMVELGIGLGGVLTQASLKQSLSEALRTLGFKVKKIQDDSKNIRA